MLTTMMTALFVSTIPGLGLRPGVVFQDPPVEVWLSKTDRLERGDRIRVHARADEDGYLLVLHAEPGGRIRVLFPLDPVDDHFIRAGEEYEIRGRGERAAFQVMESSGSGAVFAAFSRDPFRFDQLVRGDHWDYTLDTWAIGDDAEGDLVRLADLLSGGAAYEYDLVRYKVNGYVAHGRYGRRLGLYAGSYYGRSSFGVSWGDPYYYSPWYYRPYRYVYYDPYYDPYYEPFFPFWYDACWYGPCYYRAHYYGWYSPRYYYRGYYYSRGYYDYWHGGSAWRDGGRYTFKGSAAPRGIEPRSRTPLAGAVTRRLLSPEDNRGGSIGRRTLGVNTAPQSPANGGRRVFTNDGQGTPRTPARVTPGTTRRQAGEPTRQGTGTVRTPGRVTTPARPQSAQPQTDAGRRGVQDPRRLTPDARERVPERRAEPRGEVNRRELRDRMIQPQQQPQQRPQPETREAPRPRLERRGPPREPTAREPTAREAPRPRAEPRSAPPPRAEPRSSPPPRAVPRSSPPPRAVPRSSPPPRSAPAPRSGGSVPRRRG